MNQLKKAVIPIAGLGTRMLPASKAIPKEMFPIIDKPIIQYVVEEIILSGFTEIILVTHSSKNSIENHFDTSFELEATLEKRIKRSLLREIKSISKLKSNVVSVRQGEAKGLGHAILMSKHIVGNEPFAVVLPDRVMNEFSTDLKINNLSKMRKEFLKDGNAKILLEKVLKKEVENFGIAKLKKNQRNSSKEIIDIVEKPKKENAPSNFAVVGRYIFNSNIFDFIEHKEKKGKEIELTDAIKNLINSGNKIDSCFLKGECFDCGNKKGYVRAIMQIAKNRADFKNDFKKLIY